MGGAPIRRKAWAPRSSGRWPASIPSTGMNDEPDLSATTALVTGATGYIGGRLVARLLEIGCAVRVLVRDPNRLDPQLQAHVDVVTGDVGDPSTVARAAADTDVSYYLIHSMSAGDDFEERDRELASSFAEGAAEGGTGRIVYLGGLGDPDDELSPHLRSRQEVGEILRSGSVPVTELRAAIIIGSGSASFEMLRSLVEVLPAMVVPRWVDRTRCQPIAVRDVLGELVAAAEHGDQPSVVLEIGGPDVLTYREMMEVYAEEAGLRRRLIVGVPVLSPTLSSRWVSLVTPLPGQLATTLVDSLMNDVVVLADRPEHLPPPPTAPLSVRASIRRAISQIQDLRIPTRWSGASPAALPSPWDPSWSGGTVMEDRKVRVTSAASAEDLFATFAGIGGARGWFAFDRLWWLRGLADQVVGGPGLRRGRRHPDDVRIGEALDFWRVETVEPGRRILLRAEMRLPGHGWLEWAVDDHDDGVELVQRARFAPRGLWGRLYWTALIPFHGPIFGRLADEIVRRAEERSAAAADRPA